MNKIYWVLVEVNFDAPLPSADKCLSDAVGFLQTFGCTADTENTMKTYIYSSISQTQWLENLSPEIIFEISIIDHSDVDTEIYQDDEINKYLISSPYVNGLWYQSGRSYYHEDEDEDEDEGCLIEVAPIVTH